MSFTLSIGQCATLAVLMEVTASKPGNVHRGADFEDVNYFQFAAAAVAISPAMESAAGRPVGQTVLAAVEATRRLVGTNTNLGSILLIAPLAAVPRPQPLGTGVQEVLARLTAQDSHAVYEAIRLANPGGIGSVPEADVAGPPPHDLISAMRLAADRDLVARQYINGFREVLGVAVPWLREALAAGWPISETIVHVHLRLMNQFPDSLIARKCGPAVAQQAADRAAAVLEAGRPGDEAYYRVLADLDFWLRSDHHRRNPGTTADLIAAALFAALREGLIEPPLTW
jgi:triphosphoribosyl-dephospho-CoA synthase